MVIVTKMNIARQQGVVLFIALIVLVVMSMAGIAMNQSISTAQGIAGNLAFRKSALQGTEKAMANAISWLDNNRASLNLVGSVNSLTTGYYFAPAKNRGSDNAWTNSYWTTAFNVGTDTLGNSLSYKIERMCEDSTLAYTDTVCLLGTPVETNSNNGNTASGGFQFSPPPPLVFRITARAVGPRNSTSIVQAYYQIPM